MNKLVHHTLTVERSYPVAAAKVYAAWADPKSKAKWFAGPEPWRELERNVDFRVGGEERVQGRFGAGPTTLFVAKYFEIIPDQRIVYAYEMFVDGRRISISLATIEILAEGDHTRMVVTEMGAYNDGQDAATSREQGTNFLMDKLGASIGFPPTG
ncbi:MAG: SRPBCC domain-containing protein [Myxococcota bacterium]